MYANSGWHLVADHNGVIREFVVAEKTEIAAKLAVPRRYPDITMLDFINAWPVAGPEVLQLRLPEKKGRELNSYYPLARS